MHFLYHIVCKFLHMYSFILSPSFPPCPHPSPEIKPGGLAPTKHVVYTAKLHTQLQPDNLTPLNNKITLMVAVSY